MYGYIELEKTQQITPDQVLSDRREENAIRRRTSHRDI